ncbi:MAG: exopolyphosphatase [Myxococcota bacterium]
MSEAPETIAAVDLGSNSFHMVVARVVDGQVHIVDRLRERVALASGLDERKQLSAEAQQRALDALHLFGQRVARMEPGTVRAVGTNTLRQMKKSRRFLRDAEGALGFPIEVISGREEARLIYLGVAHSTEDRTTRRLVIDIGGGSTECIIGEGFEPLEADSLYMGCVTFSRFFPRGQIKPRFMEDAMTAAALELRPMERRYKTLGWQGALGSSGTITAVQSIALAEGFSNRGITPKALKRLRKAMYTAGSADALDFDGMAPDRAAVLAPGVAILSAVFERLGIERMSATSGALREGLLFDLLGRFREKDVREETIRSFSARFHVDQEQGRRVEATALRFLEAAREPWDLGLPVARQTLGWAARLHEIGKAISYSSYHKHGEYLVRHSDMPGFSREDQRILAALILSHRRKLRLDAFDSLPVEKPERVVRLAILLRLAVLLNRNRDRRAVPTFRFSARKKQVELRFPDGWLEDNRLAVADLQAEAELLQPAGYRLEVGSF